MAADLSTSNLILNYQRNPLGIDDLNPCFGWQLVGHGMDTVQRAYRIQVCAAQDPEIRWDSGQCVSDQSIHVPYEGPNLSSRARYNWRVKVWDNHGNESDWSNYQSWEMGLLDHGDWAAKWITYPWKENPSKSSPSPIFRKSFGLDAPVKRARLYVAALGLYEGHINGQRVGDRLFTPGWTAYDKRLQYQTFDITDLLQQSKNAIAVTLGDGWYRGRLGWVKGIGQTGARNTWGDRLALLAQMEIECEDGRSSIIGTDQSWQCETGAIRASDIYDGEIFDSRLDDDWSDPEFESSHWRSAVLFGAQPPRLVAGNSSTVRSAEILAPASETLHGNGSKIFDFGQNLVGWVRLQVRGESGKKITLRHGEVLDHDNSVYLGNLRSARQCVSYVLNGTLQSLEPHFTFQGFRYAALEGLDDEVEVSRIEAVVIHSDMPRSGHFETSCPDLNQLQHNIVWGQKGNFLDVPTDCPQRDERFGWTGDAQMFAPTAAFNFNVATFFEKWLGDLAEEQHEDGCVPVTIPDGVFKSGFLHSLFKVTQRDWFPFQVGPGSTGWSDAATIIPIVMYRHFGDIRFVRRQFPSMKAWVDYLADRASVRCKRKAHPPNWMSPSIGDDERYILRGLFTFGDWLCPVSKSDFFGLVPMEFVNTLFLAHSSSLVSYAASLLGLPAEEHHYRTLSDRTKLAFRREFFPNGEMAKPAQGALVLALAHDMLPEDVASRNAALLNQMIVDSGATIGTGILATAQVLHVLTRYGYVDTAFAMLMQHEFPSWLYTVDRGATTMWERWNSIKPDGSFGNSEMNSFNHYAYGSVGDWMYKVIGGLEPLSPGYKLFRVAPHPGGGLEWARTTLETGYGRVETHWRLIDGHYHLEIHVPANTSAEVIVPEAAPAIVGSGVHQFTWPNSIPNN